MSTYTFYIHTISGDIATLDNWRSDYESMDAESWHGKPAEECNAEEWIKDGKLEEIELNSDDECFLTNRVFTFWHGDADCGEKYFSEWACEAEDEDGERYEIVWRFPAVKGEEPEDDGWPWDDESFIHHIEAI